MNDPWETLRSAAITTLDPLWYDFAKVGNESAVLAPLAGYPIAAAWLAGSMATADYYITRKLGAMLAGWIDDPRHVRLLSEMLDHERQLFPKNSLDANSVGECIMFAATRWTQSQNPQVRNAGIDILAAMIRDALAGVHWNTAHWAVANLHHATHRNHAIFPELARATEAQLHGQQFLQRALKALQQNDQNALDGYRTPPSPHHPLPSNDPHYPIMSSLWNAAAAAESAATS